LISIFLDRVAKHILSCHAQDSPDLRGATVLLPNYQAAQPLAQSLSAAANLPALLLPQMVTLNDWAQSITLGAPIQPDTQRITALYQALRERRWFADADLWSLSRELLGLMDELTRHHVSLPQSADEFSRQLAEAYRARSGHSMQFEARVVHELWYAMASGGEIDGDRAAIADPGDGEAMAAGWKREPRDALCIGQRLSSLGPDLRFGERGAEAVLELPLAGRGRGEGA